MRTYPSPRLVTDSMSGQGTIRERYSMAGRGSDPIDPPSPIEPFEDLSFPSQQDHVEVNPQRDRVDGNPVPGGAGPWSRPADNSGWRQPA